MSSHLHCQLWLSTTNLKKKFPAHADGKKAGNQYSKSLPNFLIPFPVSKIALQIGLVLLLGYGSWFNITLKAFKMAAAVIVSAADLSECVELHAMRNLYLKPISKLVIVVTMPAFKVPGIFYWLFLPFSFKRRFHTFRNFYFLLFLHLIHNTTGLTGQATLINANLMKKWKGQKRSIIFS